MKPDVSGSITRATIRSPLTPLFLLTALAVGLVATVIVTVLVTRIARRALAEATGD